MKVLMAKKVPQKTKDLPATHGMLFEVRDELNASINGVKKELQGKMEAGFSEMKSLFHQAMLRFEEQRSENKVVLEALHSLIQRQDKLDSEFVEVRDIVRSLAKGKSLKGRA